MAPSKREVKPDQETIPQIGIKLVPVEIAEKLQRIAGIEGLTFNEIYNLAFVKLIESYEAKNGKLKPRAKGKGLEGI